MRKENKCPYICGPLTELIPEEQKSVKLFYESIANSCEKIIKKRAFVPHEHYDPIKHVSFTPQDVYKGEQHQVCDLTSLLIVVPVAPSWGGGIEVEMANSHNIPILILCNEEKLEKRKISRLVLGSPLVRDVISYSNKNDALRQLEKILTKYKTFL